jgi:hypothetical protein
MNYTLILAEDLDAYHTRPYHKLAAMELRRLAAIEEQHGELLAMLKDLVDLEGPQPGNSAWGDRALDLISKIEGGAA